MSGMKQGTLPENLQAQKNNKRNIMNNNIKHQFSSTQAPLWSNSHNCT